MTFAADRTGATDRAETLFDLLAGSTGTPADCLVDDGVNITWAELFDKSRALATGFAELGVGAGDRVALWLPNRAAWLLSFFACAQLGAIAVSINTRFRSAEVGDLLDRSGSKLLVYWPRYKEIDFSGILAQCATDALDKLEKLVLYAEDDGTLPDAVAGKPAVRFSALLARPPMTANHGKPEGPCIIFTTSGTTRAPKLVMHSQRNVLGHARNVARQYGLGIEDRFLLLPPLCGVYGFCSAMATLVAGARLIMNPTWNPAKFAELIEVHAVTHLAASNEAVAQLFDVRPASRAFTSIEFIVSANINPAYADIALRGEALGLQIVGLYGSSEMQALFSQCDREAPAEKRGRAGGVPASTLAQVRIRDPESRQLCKTGEAGELEIFAPESRFIEYFNDAQATHGAFTEDGYFKTGDLAFVEEDGAFTYLARMGDTLRLGGFLVSPAEIEELIQEVPAVASCQIVGVRVRDALRPVAFVIARSGANVNEAEVIAYAGQRLAKYKVPVKVYVVDEFPTTPSANGAKVQKGKLREMAEGWLALPAKP